MQQIKNADVVVVASSVLRSVKYYERLALFTCVGEGLVKAKAASHFASCYDEAMDGLSEQVLAFAPTLSENTNCTNILRSIS